MNHSLHDDLSSAITCLCRFACASSSFPSFSTFNRQRSRSFFRFVAAAFGSSSPPIGGVKWSISFTCRRCRVISSSYRAFGTAMS